jgi:hypothetical protein
VTKLEDVAAQPAESTSLQCPLAGPLAPVDHGRESVVFNGNTFGEFVVINIASPNSTGAGESCPVERKVLRLFAIDQLNKLLFHTQAEPRAEPGAEPRTEPRTSK